MNHRRIAAAAGTAWFVSIPFGAFIHHGMLGSIYAANAAAFRPDPEIVRRLPIGYAVQLYIEYQIGGDLTVNQSLLSVVLRH
jgi:hypothetical protein